MQRAWEIRDINTQLARKTCRKEKDKTYEDEPVGDGATCERSET